MSLLKDYLIQLLQHSEFQERKVGLFFIFLFFLFSYGCYFFLEREFAIRLAQEDDLFENLTAILFLVISFIFLRAFVLPHNLFSLILSILFFVGCGEEISWGQQIIGFDGHEELIKRNLQNEFNLHNLAIFHPQDEWGLSKHGFAKLITIDFLYNLFWLSWSLLIPNIAFANYKAGLFIKKIQFPIPTLSIGILFLINYAILFILRSAVLNDKADLFYMKIREVY